MIYLLSHNDKTIKNQIDTLIGKPFGLRERWLMGGNGSGGLLVMDGDDKLLACLPQDGSIRKCNIELRSGGIIVGFHKGMETYGWVVPYYMLTLFGDLNYLTLYGGPHQLKLKWTPNHRAKKRFLETLLKLRSSHIQPGSLP